MLAVTIPELKVIEPSSQDASAFYLANIYLLLADPNASVGSVPSTFVASSVPPPTYVVVVNILWLMALVISLSGAALATLEREFITRHVSITQDKGRLPETRGRIRAMLVTRPTPYAFFQLRRRFEILPMLHVSLFLFLSGVLIYVYNIDSTLSIFLYLVGCAGSFIFLYAWFTVLPFFWPSEIFYTPFSPMVFNLFFDIVGVISTVLSWIIPRLKTSGAARRRYYDLNLPNKEGFIGWRKETAEKVASKPSQEIDTEVLGRILLVLDNDHALEGFFDAIPAFCDSKMVQKPLDEWVTTRLQQTLDAFLDRTFSSHLVTESARNDRLITCLNAAHSALAPSGVSEILGNFFNGHRDEALKSVEIGHLLVRWGHSSDDLIEPKVRRILARIIAHPQDRDDRWARLVEEAFGIPSGVIRDYLAHGDSALLAILIHVTREALLADHLECHVLESLSRFDIRNTSAELQHDFCTLWNQIVQEARNNGSGSTPTQILAEIRHLFTDIHHGTDSAPIRFPAPISDDDSILAWPWSYRSCNIASHHPDSPAADDPATTSPTVPPLDDSQNTPPHPQATAPSRLPLTVSRDLAPKNATVGNVDISVTPGIADLDRGSNSGGSSALQQAEEAGTMSRPLVPGSLPTPIPPPALHSADSVVPPPSIDSALIQTEHDRHSLGAPSLRTIPLSVAPQADTVSSQYPDILDGITSAQYDNQDTHPLILSEDGHPSPPGGATAL